MRHPWLALAGGNNQRCDANVKAVRPLRDREVAWSDRSAGLYNCRGDANRCDSPPVFVDRNIAAENGRARSQRTGERTCWINGGTTRHEKDACGLDTGSHVPPKHDRGLRWQMVELSFSIHTKHWTMLAAVRIVLDKTPTDNDETRRRWRGRCSVSAVSASGGTIKAPQRHRDGLPNSCPPTKTTERKSDRKKYQM